ncbi:centrosomal protein of 162 kDa-like isoform X2 [Actinia tenebrosa]|uniref:Centrosomal protein of 162 kDa n=1 Tax=Actinia tenebrosa TaxID=6105 RepID=A0A6P8HY89_ACTTE|nr:centrosomal protein of 162 kDa-like isoform X2 [Actinia tenebrosa]
MTERWDSLRSKFQGKNIDLDAEFEKFLNESLSDESLASPRHKAPSLKTKLSKDSDVGSLPWWAEEDEDEDKKRESLRQSWLKPKPKENVDDEGLQEGDSAEMQKTEATQPTPVGISQDTNHGDSSPVSISKDSLEEVARKSLQKEKFIPEKEDDIPERPLSEEETGTYENSDDVETGNSSVSPSHDMMPSEAPPPGPDTLQEEEDKLKFFQEQMRDGSQFDYKEELEGLSTTDSPEKERDDKLQATGVELGDSIFNATDHHSEEADVDKSEDQQDGADDEDDYSDQFEESHDQEEHDGKEEPNKQAQPALDQLGLNKPSLLSKVSLMDSLDSTLDRNKQQPKMQLEKPKAFEGTSASGSGLKTTGTGNLYSGTTDTIAELQAALQQVQMNATDRSQQDRGLQPLESQHEDQLLLQKSSTGETKSRGFSLRPSVITDSSPAENELKKRQLLTNIGSAGNTLTSDSIDSASLPVDCRGFSLKPSEPLPSGPEPGLAVDSRGIPLDSRVVPLDSRESRDSFTEEKRGLDLQPVANILAMIDKTEGKKGKIGDDDTEDEDTPPLDSLRSIKAKAKARKSVDTKKREPTKKTTNKKGVKSAYSPVRVRGSKGSLPETSTGVPQKKGKRKEKGNQSVGKSNLDQWQPSMSSPPSWSPTPSMRKSKLHMESKIPSPKIKTKSNRPDQDVPESSAHHIAESVESFANYLKHLVRPNDEDRENLAPITPRWSDDEPVKSRASIRATSVDDRMERISREQRFQSEVENWQTAWKDERRRNDKLIADFAARERELSRKEEKTRLNYEEQIHDLKQEIYSLQARLQEEQENADNRRKVASGGDLKGITEEEKKRLEKEIREQEKLMKGYQQENERLYKELKQIQAKGKTTEARMFAENQKLATEVANLKEKLDQHPGQPHYSTPGSAVLGADRINYLQDQLGSYRRRETKTEKELDELRHVNMTLEQRMRAAERERDDAVERANQALGTSTQEQSQMKIRYESEIERLNRKLKWYAENQEILDRDLVKIKVKDQEIKNLKETVERLKRQQGKEMVERKERTNERTADAKRIRDLKRQVREMEEIIKRRYPNSLPALILAASSVPGVAQQTTDESPKKQPPSYVFLENQVKKLQSQLEEKDDEASRRIRAIEQKYNAMKFDYEERIKELEQSLKLANEKPRPSAHPHTHAQALEKELAAVREGDRRRIEELESEISVLQEALGRMSSLQAHVKNKKKKIRREEVHY